MVALVLRLSAAASLPLPLAGDASGYDGFGALFAEHGRLLDVDGSPLTYRPPGYPFFVGVVYSVFGHKPHLVVVLQALLDTALVAFIYFFLQSRYSSRVALLAAAAYAVSPAAIFSAGSLLSESVGTFMLLLCAALTLRAGESDRAGSAAFAGLLAAALTLTRSVMLFFPGVLVASILAVTALSPGRRMRLVGVLCLSYVAGLTPWLFRNAAVLGKPMLSTNAGDTLYSSWVHPPGHLWGNNTRDEVTAQAQHMGAVESDSFLFKKALEHLRRSPGVAVGLMPEKFALLVAPFDWEIVGRGRQRSWNLHWPLMALLAAWALRDRRLRMSPAGVLVWVGFGSLLLTSTMFYGSPRFRVPFEALLVLPAAVALDGLWSRRASRVAMESRS
ncbi:MAG: glycosyltransferase family 39 protein [Archangium sp.]|nr:glycosyltransferase family 39 protein [Archangium sp.]